MSQISSEARYTQMEYRRCGASGLKLPSLSLGLWHNFGESASYQNCKAMILGSFDRGITHFDLANNYGPPPGSAEKMFGTILHREALMHRDEMVISTKAGYHMWEGPYGEWGSKKHLVSSLDQSLKRLQLGYVDIFYHHRPDPLTPLEETAQALVGLVRAGKALYIGISNYGPEDTVRMITLLERERVHCLVNQIKYSMLERDNQALFPILQEHGVGGIAYSPLAQGLLTGKYVSGIPIDSRAAGKSVFLTPDSVTPEVLGIVRDLSEVAEKRGQKLAQMALAWVLHQQSIVSVILGASRMEQVDENLMALQNLSFSPEETDTIESILGTS